MIGFKETIEFIKLSKRSQISVFVSCLLIIGLAQFENVLRVLGIVSIVITILPIVSLLTIALFGFLIGAPIYDFFNSKYIEYTNKKRYSKFLQQLTNDEKVILKTYLDQNIRAQYFNIQDGVSGGLIAKKILYRSSNVGLALSTSFACNIQDIAFNILKIHPEYLEINNDK